MKKLTSILLSLALVLSLASIDLFATMPDGVTTVQYNIQPTYTVVIPETVNAGDNLSITASVINLEPNYQVSVRIIAGITEQSSVMLIRQSVGGSPEEALLDESNVLYAPVTFGAGSVDNNIRIATFRGLSTDNCILDTLFIDTPSTVGKLAGTYKGTLMFSITYESMPD